MNRQRLVSVAPVVHHRLNSSDQGIGWKGMVALRGAHMDRTEPKIQRSLVRELDLLRRMDPDESDSPLDVFAGRNHVRTSPPAIWFAAVTGSRRMFRAVCSMAMVCVVARPKLNRCSNAATTSRAAQNRIVRTR